METTTVKRMLIITETQGYLMLSLKEKLEEEGYIVTIVKADIDEISKMQEKLSVVLIYGDETLAEKTQALIYIKDQAAEMDVPVFATGSREELADIEALVGAQTIRQKFVRPINVNELVSAIDTYVEKFGGDNKKKILVVDDSGAMLRNVKGWLEESYQVSLANSAAMAIKAISTNRPDLVLLDYEMPIVDGKQVLEMIRSEHDFADIPVIFLTSREDQETRDGAMALNPEGYLLKSMEPAEIVQAIDDFFGGLRRKELAGL